MLPLNDVQYKNAFKKFPFPIKFFVNPETIFLWLERENFIFLGHNVWTIRN